MLYDHIVSDVQELQKRAWFLNAHYNLAAFDISQNHLVCDVQEEEWSLFFYHTTMLLQSTILKHMLAFR